MPKGKGKNVYPIAKAQAASVEAARARRASAQEPSFKKLKQILHVPQSALSNALTDACEAGSALHQHIGQAMLAVRKMNGFSCLRNSAARLSTGRSFTQIRHATSTVTSEILEVHRNSLRNATQDQSAMLLHLDRFIRDGTIAAMQSSRRIDFLQAVDGTPFCQQLGWSQTKMMDGEFPLQL